LIKIDGKVRRDHGYPIGIMDTISIEKTGENFRLLYDAKGRFKLHKLAKPEEANVNFIKF
jgi:small subunit ribosomal protein S4e